MEKMLAHEEIRALITALGTGFGETMNMEKLRYRRVIIMADADVDGSHIRTLLLTFFFRYMRPLIDEGCLYIAQPPLYRIQVGRAAHVDLQRPGARPAPGEGEGRAEGARAALQGSGRDEPGAALGDDAGPGEAHDAAGEHRGRDEGRRDLLDADGRRGGAAQEVDPGPRDAGEEPGHLVSL